MKVSFTEAANPAAVAQPQTALVAQPQTALVAQPQTALVAQPPRTLAAPVAYIEDDEFSGELSPNSVSFPFISLVHAVSVSAEHFEPGSFIYGSEFQLVPKNVPFYAYVVKAALLYKEVLSKEASQSRDPGVYKTAVQVVENGGQMDNYGQDVSYYGPLARLTLLVKQPDGLSSDYASYFPYQVDGVNYALGKFEAFKSAYTGVANLIFRLKLQKKPIRGTGWKIVSFFKKADNSYWVPKAYPLPANPNVAAFIEDIGI
jgi:hypothetical protein